MRCYILVFVCLNSYFLFFTFTDVVLLVCLSVYRSEHVIIHLLIYLSNPTLFSRTSNLSRDCLRVSVSLSSLSNFVSSRRFSLYFNSFTRSSSDLNLKKIFHKRAKRGWQNPFKLKSGRSPGTHNFHS